MKAIKTILFLFVIFTFIQCNKDAKVEPIVRVIPNGTYQFSYKTKYGQGFFLYKIIDNKIYGFLKRRDICFSKVAGELKLFDDSVRISSLLRQKPTDENTCIYYNEIYGGDTSILHLFDIEIYKDNNLRPALKGNLYYLSPSPQIIMHNFGSFNLTYTPNQ
jgi:hypothetical protein